MGPPVPVPRLPPRPSTCMRPSPLQPLLRRLVQCVSTLKGFLITLVHLSSRADQCRPGWHSRCVSCASLAARGAIAKSPQDEARDDFEDMLGAASTEDAPEFPSAPGGIPSPPSPAAASDPEPAAASGAAKHLPRPRCGAMRRKHVSWKLRLDVIRTVDKCPAGPDSLSPASSQPGRACGARACGMRSMPSRLPSRRGCEPRACEPRTNVRPSSTLCRWGTSAAGCRRGSHLSAREPFLADGLSASHVPGAQCLLSQQLRCCSSTLSCAGQGQNRKTSGSTSGCQAPGCA